MQNIIELRKVPFEICHLEFDLTPVDLASNAIYNLIFNDKSNQIIYHVYNSNILSMKDLIELLNKIGFNISIMEKDSMFSVEEKKKINKIIYDLYPILLKENIKVSNVITTNILKNLNFTWDKIDKNYILKIINYMKKMNFID